MREIKAITVFCGSAVGSNPAYKQAAEELGRLMAAQNITLVFGGGSVGMMGAVADAVLENNGHVIGVIPEFLATKELRHERVANMRVVETMHERKALMAELSDAFIAMPGGLGTFEEFFEVVTWGQLGIHEKPIGLLNAGGFYDSLISFLDHAKNDGFFRAEHQQLITVTDDPCELLEILRVKELPHFKRWAKPIQT